MKKKLIIITTLLAVVSLTGCGSITEGLNMVESVKGLNYIRKGTFSTGTIDAEAVVREGGKLIIINGKVEHSNPYQYLKIEGDELRLRLDE